MGGMTATSTITAYFGRAEQSERFYRSVAAWLGYVIEGSINNGFQYFGMCEIGVAKMGDEIGDYKRFTVKINYGLITAINSDLLKSFFDKIKPAGWVFLFEQN